MKNIIAIRNKKTGETISAFVNSGFDVIRAHQKWGKDAEYEYHAFKAPDASWNDEIKITKDQVVEAWWATWSGMSKKLHDGTLNIFLLHLKLTDSNEAISSKKKIVDAWWETFPAQQVQEDSTRDRFFNFLLPPN